MDINDRITFTDEDVEIIQRKLAIMSSEGTNKNEKYRTT